MFVRHRFVYICMVLFLLTLWGGGVVVHRPRLSLARRKQSIEQRSEKVNCTSNVENILPLLCRLKQRDFLLNIKSIEFKCGELVKQMP